MNTAISHRGPDESITIHFDNCSLGMNRLNIKGKGHLADHYYFLNQSISVVFNGEIYNYKKLRFSMQQKGFIFKKDLEIELIALLYAFYGEKFILRIDGMFAIAIFDKKHLLLYRDRLGIKPLFYAKDITGGFYFASEIKAILRTGAIFPEINPSFLTSIIFILDRPIPTK